MLDIKGRQGLSRVVDPLARALVRARIHPTAITLVGLAVTGAAGVVFALGHPTTAALVAAAGTLLDTLDGPVARASGKDSARGAFVDSVSDRIAEAALFTGLGFWLHEDRTAVTLVVVALAASMLVPYVRAKAEAAGAEGRGGLMGRAERLIVLLAGAFFEGLGADTLLPALWLLAVLTTLTVAQRIRRTWAQLDG